MAGTHTQKQIEANQLDLETFRLSRRIEDFAKRYRDQDVDDMSATMDAMRRRLRDHMHRKDREATQP